MASMKREHSALSTSDNVSARPTKRSKHAHSSKTTFARHVSHAAGAGAGTNNHHPGGSRSKNNKEKVIKPNPSINKHRPAHRAMMGSEKRAKQQHLDEQVGFIILRRDNNKPDPYGTVSTTDGPSSWTIVAKAYNEKYGVSVTPAAMEKRARQHRTAWITKHPSYPTQITYTKRNGVPPASGAGTTGGKTENRNTQRVSENDTSYERIAGWIPPDDLRNASDLCNYIERAAFARPSAVTIEIFNAREALLGTATIDRQILQENSSGICLLDNNEAQIHVQLRGPLEKILQCYATCKSSKALPQSTDDETYNGVSLLQLYCLAAQLKDDHVQGLVMNRWRLLSEQDKDVELVLDDLNLLFESTRCSDPAHEVWVRSIYAAGLAEQLLAMDGCGFALADCLQRLEAEESVRDMGDDATNGGVVDDDGREPVEAGEI